jgi:hypothetical protein
VRIKNYTAAQHPELARDGGAHAVWTKINVLGHE